MTVVKVGTLLTEMQPLMTDVEVVTGGYVTEISNFKCEKLEQVAISTGMDKIQFYVNEKGEFFTFHFAHMLNLQESICAIDYFQNYSPEEVNKVTDVLFQAIKKYQVLRTTL